MGLTLKSTSSKVLASAAAAVGHRCSRRRAGKPQGGQKDRDGGSAAGVGGGQPHVRDAVAPMGPADVER